MTPHTTPPSCTYDDKGNKTDDCNYCGCPDSSRCDQHSPYHGTCLHCGKSTS